MSGPSSSAQTKTRLLRRAVWVIAKEERMGLKSGLPHTLLCASHRKGPLYTPSTQRGLAPCPEGEPFLQLSARKRVYNKGVLHVMGGSAWGQNQCLCSLCALSFNAVCVGVVCRSLHPSMAG